MQEQRIMRKQLVASSPGVRLVSNHGAGNGAQSASPDVEAIITLDEDGCVVDCNAATEALLQRQSRELIDRPIVDIGIPKLLHAEYRQTFKRLVIGRRIRFPALRGDGSEFEAELVIVCARLELGKITYTGQMRDIGDAKRTERLAQQMVAIIESSHDAIISKDLDGTILTWNLGAELLFGYRAEEAIGKSITILIPEDRLDEEPQILARIRSGERVDHFDTVRRRKDGSLVDISLTISPVRDASGRIVGASKIARDISERKEMHAKLVESQRQLKDLLAAIPAAIYTTDALGRITYFNEKAVELAGRTPIIGEDEWCVTWKLYRPDGTPMRHDECPMAIALREGRAIRNAEALAERPDGTRVPFIPYPSPLFDSQGKIVGAINMLVDISERKQAETQQRLLFDELNHRVKNNMQVLQSILSLAASRARGAEAMKVLNEARGRVAAMAAAQQVLYGTRDTTRFRASEFLGAVCGTVQQTLPEDARIVWDADDSELSSDSAMPLALILNELLTNAMKYGLKKKGESVIRIGLARDGDEVLLRVEDDGAGFDVEEIRQRSSGLQLVQGLARQLRGRFYVERHPRTCCCVRFS